MSGDLRYGIVGCAGIGNTHAEAVRAADVLCEKPLDVYADRVDRMVEACEDAGVTLAGVFQERFDPDMRRAKRAVAEGELGEPILGEAAVKSGDDRTTINGTEGSLVFDNRGDGIVDFQVGTGEGHYGVIQDFVTALWEGREPEVPASEARAAVDIILAAYKSAESGQSVPVKE